jgi:hypothetical protein
MEPKGPQTQPKEIAVCPYHMPYDSGQRSSVSLNPF